MSEVLSDFYSEHAMRSGVDSGHFLTVQRRQIDTARKTDSLSTVLDLGAGGGASTVNAIRSLPTANIVGVDISALALDTYRKTTNRSPLRASLGVGLPFRSDSVDAVMCDDVIEHMVDPDRLARETRRVLRPGGHLFLTTPNLAAWFNRVLLGLGRQPLFSEVSLEGVFGRPGTDIVGHMRLYTKPALVEFLEHHGFEIVALDGAGFDALPRWVQAVDRGLARMSTTAAILVCWARKPANQEGRASVTP